MTKLAQRGQALLIILLVMAVILTVSLSVISRSVTDLRVSRQDEDSARVFSIAEAGIEQLLLSGSPGTYGSDYQVAGSCATVGNETAFDFGGGRFDQGVVQTLWLVGHGAGGALDPSQKYTGNSLTLFWGNQSASEISALEATLFYDNGGVKTARFPFDPDGGRRWSNGFTLANSGGSPYPYSATINDLNSLRGAGGTLYALRLKPLYNSQPIGLKVEAPVALPAQGDCCESTATRIESGITRKVRQCRFFEAPPAIFDYVLYSGASLVK
ncbi:MAG: pilus assembly PilX N-terminal domain-containing protein [Candidatus Shapirobacteria bacterium]